MRKKLLSMLTALCLTAGAVVAPFGSVSPADKVFAADNGEDPQIVGDLDVKGTDSFGKILEDEISSVYEDVNSPCRIQSVEIEGMTAKVQFSSAFDCTVVVGIYDESGEKLITSGNAEVSALDAGVIVDIEGSELPEYFLVRAYLVDSRLLHPLCKAFENPNYTRVMQEFFAMTTEDFPAERVINFDDDITSNFAVFNEGTKMIPAEDGVNTLVSADEESGVYVFENADERIASLAVGDILAYDNGAEMPLIVKVGSIESDGGRVCVKRTDIELEEVFEHLEIEKQNDASTAVIDDSVMDSHVEYLGVNVPAPVSPKPGIGFSESLTKKPQVEDPYIHDGTIKWDEGLDLKEKIGLQFKVKESGKDNLGEGVNDKWEISGSLSLAPTINIRLYVGSKVPKYLEIKVDLETGIGLTISASIEKKISLPRMLWIVYGVSLKIEPAFVLKASGKVEISGKLTDTVGFRAYANSAENISKNPKFSAGIKSTGEYFVGFSLEPGVYFLSEWLVDASATAEAGVKIKTEYEKKVEMDSGDAGSGGAGKTEKHDCNNCIKGTVWAEINISLSGKLLGGTVKFVIAAISVPVDALNFYVSETDHMDFGFGVCPYKSYKVDLKLKDSLTGKPVDFAAIKVRDDFVSDHDKVYTYNTETQSDVYGEASVWLHRGPFSIIVEQKGYVTSGTEYEGSVGEETLYTTSGKDPLAKMKTTYYFCIDGVKSKKLDISLEPKKFPVKITVTDTDGKPLKNVRIKTNDPLEGAASRTDINGECTKLLTSGSRKITADYTGYEEGSATVFVDPDKTSLSAKIVMQPLIGCSSIIVNNQFGNPVNNAFVKLTAVSGYKGEDVSGQTNLDGIFTRRVDVGKYELSIEKTGYETVKDTVTVEEDKPFVLEYTMNGNFNDVKLKVIGKDDKPISDVVITGDSLADKYTTDSKGIADVKMLVGSHTLKFMRESMRTSAVNVVIDEDTTEYTVKLTNDDMLVKDIFKTALIAENGDLYVWGSNLGNGTDDKSYVPVKVMEKVRYTDSYNDKVRAVITEDDTLYIWGINDKGQLGNGTLNDSTVPVKVMENVKNVHVGASCVIALTNDGDVYSWGTNDQGALGLGLPYWSGTGVTTRLTPQKVMSGVSYISSDANDMFFAATEEGELYVWGAWTAKFLAQGQDFPTEAPENVNDEKPRKLMDNAVFAVAGNGSINAIQADGSFYIWVPKLIYAEDEYQYQYPKKVLDNAVTCTMYNVIDSDGKSYLINSSARDAAVYEDKELNNVGRIVSGYRFSNPRYAITSSDELYMQGWNVEGCFGDGYFCASADANKYPESKKYMDSPAKIMDDVKKVIYLTNSMIALTTDGLVYVWGKNTGKWLPLGENADDYVLYPRIVHVHADDESEAPAPNGMPKTGSSLTPAQTYLKVAHFEDLVPGRYYNFYSMKSRYNASPLSSGNMYYIGQFTADENGTLTIRYEVDSTVRFADEFVTASAYTVCEHTYDGDRCTKCGAPKPEDDTVYGDVDGDGKISAYDASLALTEYTLSSAKQPSILDDEQAKRADIDGDGKISAYDASLILTFYTYRAGNGTETDILKWYIGLSA